MTHHQYFQHHKTIRALNKYTSHRNTSNHNFYITDLNFQEHHSKPVTSPNVFHKIMHHIIIVMQIPPTPTPSHLLPTPKKNKTKKEKNTQSQVRFIPTYLLVTLYSSCNFILSAPYHPPLCTLLPLLTKFTSYSNLSSNPFPNQLIYTLCTPSLPTIPSLFRTSVRKTLSSGVKTIFCL